MQLVIDTLRSAASPQPTEIAERIGTLLSPRGRSHAELDNLALQLLVEAQARMAQEVGMLRRRLRKAEVLQLVSPGSAPPGYRRIAGREAPVVSVNLGTPPPKALDAELCFRVNIALDEANPFGFQLEVPGNQDRLDVWDADLAPDLSESLKLRLNMWVRRHLSALLCQLEERTKAALTEYR